MAQKIKVTENGNNRATIELPIGKTGLKISGSLFGVVVIIGVIIIGYVFIKRAPTVLNPKIQEELRAVANENAQAISDNYRMSTARDDVLQGGIETILDRLEDMERSRSEDRRLSVALFRQMKLLCEKEGLPVPFNTEDFFERGASQ